VEGPAVRLDDEALDGPDEVDLVSLALEQEPDVDSGARQAGDLAEDEEALLELGAGQRRADRVLAEHAPQARRAGVAVEAAEEVIDRAPVEDPQHLRLVAGPLKRPPIDDAGEIEEGAGDRGAGDAPVDRAIGGRQGLSAVKLDASSAPPCAPAGGDVDAGARRSTEAQVIGRRAMRDHRAFSTGQDRRHQVSLARERPVAHGIYAFVDRVEPPQGHPLAHRSGAQSESDQLLKRNDTMLSARKLGDPPLPLAMRTFRPVPGRFVRTALHRAMVAGDGARVARAG